MKGLNIYAGKSDPVAKPDDQYPEWLWTLLDREPANEITIQYIRQLNKERIKADMVRRAK
jgi:large subunit ribosomal protein L54